MGVDEEADVAAGVVGMVQEMARRIPAERTTSKCCYSVHSTFSPWDLH